MKYRQWKKNYKKKHGVNPPLELDKRKQRRLARNLLRDIVSRYVSENVAAALSNMAAGLREESEAVEND